GLVHVSQLADRFVDDPHKVVKAGDIVKVTILDVDVPRKRISMTMKSQADYQEQRERTPQNRGGPGGRGDGGRGPGGKSPGGNAPRGGPGGGKGGGKGGPPKASGGDGGNNAMAAALAAAMNRKK
ncbi:MAG: S1 RNA-binding domain-containing protein, partial [Roseibium sp.]